MAKNKVIAGDYEGWDIYSMFGVLSISDNTKLFRPKIIHLNDNITHYEILDENSTKSASSALIRGGLGAVLLGPVGLLAGLSAKNKKEKIIALRFKDGQECIVEVDKKIFEKILTVCSKVNNKLSDDNLEKNIISEADELSKFKDLLDSGVITQEEFDLKKKQIFNI